MPGTNKFQEAHRAIAQVFKFPEDVHNIETAKLTWIVRLRWIVCTFFLLLSPAGYVVGLLNKNTLAIFVGALGLLALFNLFTRLFFLGTEQETRKSPPTPILVSSQFAVDLVAVSSLLMIAGGITNPLTPLFFVNVALGAVLIRGHYAWPYWGLSHTFFFGLQTQYVLERVDPATEISLIFWTAPHILIAAVWLVMRSLGSYLESQSEALVRSRTFTERQDRLRAIGALAAGFSHEFASPLNAAKLRLARLRRDVDSNRGAAVLLENIDAAEICVAACEKVIHEMNASQFDVGSHEKRAIPISEFLNDIGEAWREEHPEAKLNIQADLDSRVEVPVVSFAQVLINLLDNAHEAKPDGEIHMKLERADLWIKLAVEDTGPGFPDAVLERRGEPFLTTKPNGTGLGLYVSEIFAQSLGGRLLIENRSPMGARVSLTWPAFHNTEQV